MGEEVEVNRRVFSRIKRKIEGVDTSWLFRFKDDFVIEVRPDGADGSLVHMRSKSRDGKGDVGANAKRIRAFFARVAEQPAG